MNWFFFFLCALATHRLSTMLTKETGPFRVFERIRRLTKHKASKQSGMKEGIDCPLCMGTQIGLLLAIAAFFLLANPVFQVLIFGLALSDVSVILNQQFTKDI